MSPPAPTGFGEVKVATTRNGLANAGETDVAKTIINIKVVKTISFVFTSHFSYNIHPNLCCPALI
jgi:hypothetical protein